MTRRTRWLPELEHGALEGETPASTYGHGVGAQLAALTQERDEARAELARVRARLVELEDAAQVTEARKRTEEARRLVTARFDAACAVAREVTELMQRQSGTLDVHCGDCDLLTTTETSWMPGSDVEVECRYCGAWLVVGPEESPHITWGEPEPVGAATAYARRHASPERERAEDIEEGRLQRAGPRRGR